jgi:hypothetical protein
VNRIFKDRTLEDNSGVDFVLPWVDGSDPAWQEEFSTYSGLEGDARKNRYRDWENLHYLFRGVEKFAPWVRKIHFITWGHLPDWLNTEHPKVAVVRHGDFMDEKNLPIFNCNPFEVNLHRIPGLSERFVYFNDDFFLLGDINPERFFYRGLPRDILSFNAIAQSPIAHIKINNIQAINRHFDKFKVVVKNFCKIFNFRYPVIEIVKSLLLIPWPFMTGFLDHHQPLKNPIHEILETKATINN